MNKKAMVETQFNWIFALVIGAIILVMVIGFINSQREKSEQRIGLTIAKDLNTSRVVVTRLLKQLHNDGKIFSTRNKIKVLDF